MTTNQLFFAIATLIFALAGFFKYYLDAKIGGVDAKIDGVNASVSAKLDSVASQVNLLVHYMIEHQGKISTLEERTKKLG